MNEPSLTVFRGNRLPVFHQPFVQKPLGASPYREAGAYSIGRSAGTRTVWDRLHRTASHVVTVAVHLPARKLTRMRHLCGGFRVRSCKVNCVSHRRAAKNLFGSEGRVKFVRSSPLKEHV